MALGAGLRLYALDRGLWIDEVTTFVEYARPAFGDIFTTYGSKNQRFLFSLAAHASIAAFGEHAWSLRLPAAFFGIATLWAIWLFGREVTGRTESLLAVTMLTFSYQHIWFSQNARGYSGLLFWTCFPAIGWSAVCDATRDVPGRGMPSQSLSACTPT